MYQRKFDKKYAVVGGKMGQQIKTLLGMGLNFTDLQYASMLYMLDGEDFINNNGHSIGLFMTKINKYDYMDEEKIGPLKKWVVDENGKTIYEED